LLPVYYDFHIHTALSPCADDDMTPNDIVGMAIMNGLDIIAITDHNTLGNAAAVVEAAGFAKSRYGKGLQVLPGIEVSTAEEVHVLCLFSDLDIAFDFEAQLLPYYSTMGNRPDIFGNQLLLDKDDRVTDTFERMLIAPTSVSFDDLYFLTNKHDGAFIPAHVDKDSFSVMSNLGFLPPHLGIGTVEVTPRNTYEFPGCKMISSSDAHQLGSINERVNFLELTELSAKAVINFLR